MQGSTTLSVNVNSQLSLPNSSMNNGNQNQNQMGKREINDSHKMISAVIGASLTALVVTPLDVVKTRLQSQTAVVHTEKCCRPVTVWNGVIDCVCFTEPANMANSKIRFNGTFDGIMKIVQFEGFWNLWRGLSMTLVSAIPTTVIYFIGYEKLRNATRQYAEQNNNRVLFDYAPLLSGSIARTVAVSTVSPMELFRTRIQSEMTKDGAALKVFRDVKSMVQTKGLFELWRGLSPTLWRDVPFSGIYWFGYEYFRPKYLRLYRDIEMKDEYNEFLVAFSSGATSGAIAAVLTTPFDVAKTWRQVGVSQLGKEQSTFGILRTIFEQEGVKGLTRGITARISKTAPACAIMISSYELGKRYFGGGMLD